MAVEIADRPQAARYEIAVDGERVGLVTYTLRDGVITFRHAEIDPAREGQGLGSRLARYALDDARARGLAVRPRCPFIARYVERHREYLDLVVD